MLLDPPSLALLIHAYTSHTHVTPLAKILATGLTRLFGSKGPPRRVSVYNNIQLKYTHEQSVNYIPLSLASHTIQCRRHFTATQILRVRLCLRCNYITPGQRVTFVPDRHRSGTKVICCAHADVLAIPAYFRHSCESSPPQSSV